MKKHILGLQGLLSTTYQVDVTFNVKGGAEEQKSIFVKVLDLNNFLITWILFLIKKSIFVKVLLKQFSNNMNIKLKVPLTGSKAQDYKEVIFKITLKESFLEPAPISSLF